MRLSFNTLACLCLSTACIYIPISHSQTIYTWTDTKGNLHFSDVPLDQHSKAIELPDLQQPAPPPQVIPSKEKPKTEKKTNKGDQDPVIALELVITSPQHDQTLRSNAGFISIQGELTRKLKIGEQLQLIMNGSKYGAPKNKPQWLLKNIDRGSHSFTIQAFRDGKLIASSSSITVHLQRARVKKTS